MRLLDILYQEDTTLKGSILAKSVLYTAVWKVLLTSRMPDMAQSRAHE